MLITATLLSSVLFLAWANGANDNFKGVATLYGSATASFNTALLWATTATLAGSLLSVFLAGKLVTTFSGAGLVDVPALAPAMLAAVAAGAALTVFLATTLGMPTSTTHALTGALVGVVLVSPSGAIHWDVLLNTFMQPLLLSPLLAIAATAILYPLLHRLRLFMAVNAQTCLCVGEAAPLPVTISADGSAYLAQAEGAAQLRISIDDNDRCVERYQGRFFGIRVQAAVDLAHWLSGGAVCFARAVNDTPKIAALLITAGVLWENNMATLLLITAAVVAGGLLQSRKVAETMSHHITRLNTGQGLTANLITSMLVLGASGMGVPVSTTHVSCGAIFGISAVNGKRDWSTITGILLTWVTTLPLGVLLGGVFFLLLGFLDGV
jgi:PiT family inorganic phosphate transporter